MLDQVVVERRAAAGTKPREYFTQVLKLPFMLCAATAKPCYSYCLIDARLWTAQLHAAAANGGIADKDSVSSLSPAERTLLNSFANSVFYVGKGTGGRLSSHLSPQNVATGPEVRYVRIRAIFKAKGSVILLRVVDGVRPETAHNSEALLMTAVAAMKAHLIQAAAKPRVNVSQTHSAGCVPGCICLTNSQSPHWNLVRNTVARKFYRYSGSDAQKHQDRLVQCHNELFRTFRVFLLTPYFQLKMRHAADYAMEDDDNNDDGDVAWDDSGYQTAHSIVNSSSDDEDGDEDADVKEVRKTFKKSTVSASATGQAASSSSSSSSSSAKSSAHYSKSKAAK
jgi:hypothetical protein